MFSFFSPALTEKIRGHFSVLPFLSFLVPLVTANVIISTVISFPLLKQGIGDATLFTIVVNLVSFVSHYFLLNFMLGAVVFLFSGFLYRKMTLSLSIMLFFLLQTVLLIDTKIYSLFHYHINALVLNVITTEGVTDSVILGKGTVLIFAAWLTMILITEIMIHVFLAGFYKKVRPEKLSLFNKTAKVLFAVGLSLIICDKGLYAYGDLFNITAITKNAKLYPLYQPLTIKRFASNVLHMKVNRELHLKVSTENMSLRYPKEEPVFVSSLSKDYNVVIIILDGLRFDMLSKEIMPNTWSLGQENVIATNHYSGGNGTRFGIFSLLYGIDGTYWHNFLAQRRSPLLLDTLGSRGYDFFILSSTRLTFPEFRKTAFVKIPECIEDNFPGDEPEKDKNITERFIGHITSRRTEKPFFAFLFYNSSHQPYLYPKEFEKFLPVSDKEINYFRDTDRKNIHMLRNRYKNSVLYDDFLIGKIISALKESGLFEKSIVLITGDHGEEFYENGYFGHTSSFNDYQTKTVFVMHYPGIKNQVINRLTSHLDLVPTVMESLGYISPAGDYSQGISLLGTGGHEYIMVANWDKAAIVDNEMKIVYSTELYNMGAFEVHRKADYAMVANTSELLKQKRHILIGVLTKMSEFYKPI